MSSLWIGIGSLVVGAAGSLYSAKQNKKNAAAANEANLTAQEKSDQMNFDRWMMSRGVGLNGEAVNTKLPMWMKGPPVGNSGPRFRKAGSANAALPAASGDSTFLAPYQRRGGSGGIGDFLKKEAMLPGLGAISKLFG